MAAIANNQLYNLTAYGRGYLITCTDPSKCSFYEQQYLTIAADEEKEINVVSYWNAGQSGWVVRNRDVEYAREFVRFLNQDYAEQDAAETLASFHEEAIVDLEDDEDLYTIDQYGRGYLIECNDPTKSEWWGEKYIALSESSEPGIAYWNNTLEAYIVRGRDAEEAEYFVHRANDMRSLEEPAEGP